MFIPDKLREMIEQVRTFSENKKNQHQVLRKKLKN